MWYSNGTTDGSTGLLKIEKVVGGAAPAVLASKSYAITAGASATAFTMKVVVLGSKLELYVNGLLELYADDAIQPDVLKTGQIALYTNRTATNFYTAILKGHGLAANTDLSYNDTDTITGTVKAANTGTANGSIMMYLAKYDSDGTLLDVDASITPVLAGTDFTAAGTLTLGVLPDEECTVQLGAWEAFTNRPLLSTKTWPQQ